VEPVNIKKLIKVNISFFLSVCLLSIQWKSKGTDTVWLPTFFKISSFVFHTGLGRHKRD